VVKTLRPIAIYLPQFHPILENDLWWGKDFTDWVNVKKAKPQIKNHYQPHLPAEIGFYDLRDPEIREKQASMAKEHGFYGFCYYHYWFNGKRLLNLPIDEILKSKKPDFPFCLAWANEDWTRAWDGSTGNILIEQKYNHSDDLEHIRFLSAIFQDERYIRVDGKPVFIIYQPALLPDIPKTLEIWREEAMKLGIGEIYLCYFENILQGVDPQSLGFDASIEFQPNWWKLPPPINRTRIGNYLKEKGVFLNAFHKHMFFDYLEVAHRMIEAAKQINYKRYPGITPMWDNSARRKKDAAIFFNSDPEKYAFWLNEIIQSFQPFSKEENFIFINAWNEWGEGNHLEPCQKWGRAYLEVTRNLLTDNS
jgi:lipopolysaccharide biosynthesis protein